VETGDEGPADAVPEGEEEAGGMAPTGVEKIGFCSVGCVGGRGGADSCLGVREGTPGPTGSAMIGGGLGGTEVVVPGREAATLLSEVAGGWIEPTGSAMILRLPASSGALGGVPGCETAGDCFVPVCSAGVDFVPGAAVVSGAAGLAEKRLYAKKPPAPSAATRTTTPAIKPIPRPPRGGAAGAPNEGGGVTGVCGTAGGPAAGSTGGGAAGVPKDGGGTLGPGAAGRGAGAGWTGGGEADTA